MSLELELQKNARAREFCRAFRSAAPEDRLILGRNIYGRSIAERIEIGAYIDDFTETQSYHGKPIIKSKDIPSSAFVVSSLLGRPASGASRLESVGANHLDYFAFYGECELDLPRLRFWGGFKDEFDGNIKKFEWVDTLFSDSQSRSIYHDILNFRLTGNLRYMSRYTDRERFQYFEDFLELNASGEVFVDAGGYDGFTSREFIKRCPDYERIYFLEPDPTNLAVAIDHLSAHPRIEFIEAGLSKENGVVRFSQGGSVAAIDSEGSSRIRVCTLDSLVNGNVSFIKMDIEGAEKEAIKGAKSVILDSQPKLAIAAYHLDDDFWKIPELVLSIRDDYKLHLRHYTEGVAETIMFFTPVQTVGG